MLVNGSRTASHLFGIEAGLAFVGLLLRADLNPCVDCVVRVPVIFFEMRGGRKWGHAGVCDGE